MSYIESVLPLYKKGEKIRRKSWPESIYLSIDRQDDLYLSPNDLRADDWEVYQKSIDWDYIIKNKCLCWFWCKDEEERKLAGYLADYDSYNSQFGRYKGKNVAVTYFDYCHPVRRDEVTFYEEKKKCEVRK